jgi:hypothetical protein
MKQQRTAMDMHDNHTITYGPDHRLFKLHVTTEVDGNIDHGYLFAACERIFDRQGRVSKHHFNGEKKDLWSSSDIPEIDVIVEQNAKQTISAIMNTLNVPAILLFVFPLLAYGFFMSFFDDFYKYIINGPGIDWFQKVIDINNPAYQIVSKGMDATWRFFQKTGIIYPLYLLPFIMLPARIVFDRYRGLQNLKEKLSFLVAAMKNLPSKDKKNRDSENTFDHVLDSLPERKQNIVSFSHPVKTRWLADPNRNPDSMSIIVSAVERYFMKDGEVEQVGYFLRWEHMKSYTTITFTPRSTDTEIEFHANLRSAWWFYSFWSCLFMYLLFVFLVDYFLLADVFPKGPGVKPTPPGYSGLSIYFPMVIASPLAPLIGLLFLRLKRNRIYQKCKMNGTRLVGYLNSLAE